MQNEIKYLLNRDPEKLFEVLVNTYKQIEFVENNLIDLHQIKADNIRNIIVAGMGGSAISGDLIANYLKDELAIPYKVVRDYYLPTFASEKTLVIISSYSGNTEETLQVFNEAIARKCQIICCTTGGKAEQIAKANDLPIIYFDKGYQPRYSLGLNFFTLLRVFEELGLIVSQKETVSQIKENWKYDGVELSKELNKAYVIAKSLCGFLPVIYSCVGLTDSVGVRFKSQFNENSKLLAFANSIPEMNHNEIVGWECASELQAEIKVLMIVDQEYHPKIKKRFDICEELIYKSGTEVIRIESEKPTFKERLMELVFFTDWITFYSAIIRDKDPGEIDNIHHLKKKLAED